MRKYLDQEITLITGDVVRLDGTGTRILRLHQRPVTAVTLVEEESAGGDWTTIPADDYTLRDSYLIRNLESKTWRRGKANVRVTHNHGYSVVPLDSDSDSDFEAPNVPADLVLVTLNAARRAYEQMGAAPEDPALRQITVGAFSATYATAERAADLTRYERAVLDRYRI